MKNYALLILIHVACAFTLFWVACSSSPPGNKLQGKWKSKDGSTKLKITDKKFTTDDGQSVTEDYFVKGDSIFTSFEGNKPYTVFLVQKLDDNNLKLMGPDSVAMEYVR
jgi:hypothetical protein